MANKRKYTDEERAERLRQQQKEYYQRNKEKYSKCFSVSVTPTERAAQTALLNANGFTNAGDFWRHCIQLLEAGQLPPKQPTDSTGAGKPSNQ